MCNAANAMQTHKSKKIYILKSRQKVNENETNNEIKRIQSIKENCLQNPEKKTTDLKSDIHTLKQRKHFFP